MKKENIYKFLYCVSVFLLIEFAIRLGVDYFTYSEMYSAPFYTYIIVRTVECIIPSIIVFIVAKILKHKQKKRRHINEHKRIWI